MPGRNASALRGGRLPQNVCTARKRRPAVRSVFDRHRYGSPKETPAYWLVSLLDANAGRPAEADPVWSKTRPQCKSTVLHGRGPIPVGTWIRTGQKRIPGAAMGEC